MKNFLPVTIGTLALCFTNAASAREYVPYIGADYTYATAHASEGLRPHYQVFDLNVGTKYNPYFVTEVFYAQSASEHKKIEDGKLKTSYRAYGLDLATYLPCTTHADLFLTGGLGEYVLKYQLTGQKHQKDSGMGYRLGGGLMLNFNEHVSLRLLARYVALDQISDVNHMVEYGLGLRYHF